MSGPERVQSAYNRDMFVTVREEELLEVLQVYCAVIKSCVAELSTRQIVEFSAKRIVDYTETNKSPNHVMIADILKVNLKGILNEMGVPLDQRKAYSSTLEKEVIRHGNELDKMLNEIHVETKQGLEQRV